MNEFGYNHVQQCPLSLLMTAYISVPKLSQNPWAIKSNIMSFSEEWNKSDMEERDHLLI